MATRPPNTSLLDAKNQFASDTTPAPLTGPSESVTFALTKVGPPSNLYIGRDDQLVLQCASALNNDTVTFNVRLLRADGEIVPIQVPIKTGAVARTQQQVVQQLTEGYLLSISAQSSSANQRGQTFARAFINRGLVGSGNAGASQILFADYTTANTPVSWQQGRVLDPTEGPGRIYSVAQANPAAGADFTITIPNNALWRIISLYAELVTSAAVANRQVDLRFVDGTGGNVVYRVQTGVVQAASLTNRYSFANVAFFTPGTGNVIVTPIPPYFKLIGTMNSITANIQAADQWQNIAVQVEEWMLNV